jgi:hypothetical protein
MTKKNDWHTGDITMRLSLIVVFWNKLGRTYLQNGMFKNGRMQSDRRQRFMEAGLVGTIYDQNWNRYLKEVTLFRKKYGHLPSMTGSHPDEPRSDAWCTKNRVLLKNGQLFGTRKSLIRASKVSDSAVWGCFCACMSDTISGTVFPMLVGVLPPSPWANLTDLEFCSTGKVNGKNLPTTTKPDRLRLWQFVLITGENLCAHYSECCLSFRCQTP